jgi:hypothetical protein
MGQISGGTYYLCDNTSCVGSPFTATTQTNTPHPNWTNFTGGTQTQLLAVTLGGFNGLNS